MIRFVIDVLFLPLDVVLITVVAWAAYRTGGREHAKVVLRDEVAAVIDRLADAWEG